MFDLSLFPEALRLCHIFFKAYLKMVYNEDHRHCLHNQCSSFVVFEFAPRALHDFGTMDICCKFQRYGFGHERFTGYNSYKMDRAYENRD